MIPDEWWHLGPCGEDRYNAKMTDDKVVELRRRREAGERLTVLAAEYGITPSTASTIARRLTWVHVR